MIIRRIWGQTAYRKVVLSLLTILIPIYSLCIVIYQWGLQTLSQEISDSMIYQVSTSISDMETDFQRVQSLLYDALTDRDLNALANISESMNEIEKMQRTLRLQHRLNAIRNSSSYIHDVYAYIPAIEKNISALSINELDMEQFNAIKGLQYDLNSPVFLYENSQYLAIGYPFLSPNSKRNLTMLLCVEFSVSKLQKTLDAMKASAGEGVIYDSESLTLHTNPDAVDVESIISAVSKLEASSGSSVVVNNGEKLLTVYQRSTFFNASLIKYIPESTVFSPLAKFKAYFVILALTSVVILMIYALFLFQYIHKPLEKLVKAFRKAETGDMKVRVHHDSHDEFHYIYNRFNDMLENLQALIDEVYKQQILMQKAELKHLQSQINPHFLYNSFFILNTMARLGDNEQLERFTLQLGEYFQFITRNSADNVTLAKEVQHAKIYAEIQGLRFANRVQIEFGELPEHTGEVMVPRLILQPLIENAFKHAIEKKTAQGRLRVKFAKYVNGVRVSVDDNGDELDDGKIESLNRMLIRSDVLETTGILNIHQRIRLMFGEPSGLHFERNEWNGLKAVITIQNREE
ncbi:sensor histidine kinase YesM [Paenibacillus montaniterrae]|uniref:Sensor histidine kinase YesM n=1 Tax=Paenibacillus montaniterrae TaxID=429341 RepID=A0A920D1W8_9BACL|nr:histidine kinase [Paenibacillus montaniterrae]GIP19359.1 sensor histidine kinase YesM [Paenibacillus montaniterrae]